MKVDEVHQGFESAHDFGSLHCMGSRPNLEIDVRARESERLEEPIVHLGIVVLASVDQESWNRASLRLECAQYRRNLHVIRPGTDDAKHGPHVPTLSGRSHCRLLSFDVRLRV